MEMKTYLKLRAVSKPFEYEEYMKKKIKDKIEEKRQKRIIPQKRLPKVNQELANKLSKSKTGALLDDRFADVFEREEFQQDENSLEYKLRNPSKGLNTKKGGGDVSDDDLQGVYEEIEDESDNDNDDADDRYDDEDGDEFEEDDIAVYNRDSGPARKSRRQSGPDNTAINDDDEGQIIRSSKKKSNKLKMFELSEGVAPSKALFRYAEEEHGKSRYDRSEASLSLRDRIQQEKSEADAKLSKVKTIATKKGIVLESSYVPREDKVKMQTELDIAKKQRKMGTKKSF